MNEMTAEDYRKKAADNFREAQESYDRSDTDGALSQFASGLSSSKNLLLAEIAENNGLLEFPALFDLDGKLVPAKLINTRFGTCWALLESEDGDSPFASFFNPSSARDEDRRIATNAKKGFYVGTVLVEAGVTYKGDNFVSTRPVAYRKDGGWDANAIVVDNGKTYR